MKNKNIQSIPKTEKTVIIDKSITAINDAEAKKINKKISEKQILCLNILGAPGSGKTTLIQNLAEHIPKEEILVIQGDLKSDHDKKRLEEKNIETIQINTHSGCHLNAHMVSKVIQNANLNNKNFLFIENVGNLVCPAGVMIGQDCNLLVSATTEGNDKPRKYPHIFRDSQIIVISKYDLKSAVKFDEQEYLNELSEFVKNIPIIRVSSNNLESYKKLADIILELRAKKFKKNGCQRLGQDCK